jgi:hypothetical protein
MDRKQYLRDRYADLPPAPLTGWDYVLILIAFLLIAIVSVPQVAALIVHM